MTKPLSRAPAWAQTAADGAGLISAQVCSAYPETTEGPYYFDPELVRQDISEGLPGAPMEFSIQVVRPDCTPIAGARVDIWHCDADGRYSGYRRENTRGETFLRGTQVADASGVATFRTVFPGWYPGRTVHAHLMVYLNQREVLTSQAFFPEAFIDRLFTAHPAYSACGVQDTPQTRDGIARRAGDGAIAEVSEANGLIRAAMVVGVAS